MEAITGSFQSETSSPSSLCPFEFSPFPCCYDWNEKRILLHNIAMHTPKLEIGHYQDDGNIRMIRPTLHQYLIGPSGQFKTTIMLKLKEAYESPTHKILYVDDMTPSGIQGGIDDKTRLPLPPLAYLAKSGSLMLDECNFNPITHERTILSLLPILENEISSRKIGFKPKKIIETEDTTIRHGWMEFRNLRCNHILATMKNLRKNRKEYMDALISRTVPTYLNWTRKDIELLVKNPSLLFRKIVFQTEPKVIMDAKTYWSLFGFVSDYNALPDKFVARTTDDLLRIYAVTKTYDADLFDYVVQSRTRFALRDEEYW